MLRVDNTMERIWGDAYEKCQNEWKFTSNNVTAPDSESAAASTMGQTFANTSIEANHFGTPSDFNIDLDFTGLPNALMSIQQPRLFEDENTVLEVDPIEVARDWSLNAKQQVAYQLIVDQCIHSQREPLSLIITGAAGTGKSRIIHAAQDFLSCRKETYRFRLLSFTGIAAQNINGVTLHSALALLALRGQQLRSTTQQNLIKMWSNVDFLFIDEYSMIGCQMLHKIHLALTIAKECSKPFGGINIIFAGDFCQLPAVRETRLYTKFSKWRHPGNESANLENVYGRLLWLSISNVIVLQTVERQRGAGANELISLLS